MNTTPENSRDLVIRQGRADDSARMAEIFNHYVRTSTVIFSNRQLSADDMRAKLEAMVMADNFPFLIAEDAAGNILGYAYAHRWQPDPVYDATWELTQYLDCHALGRGVGTKLFGALVEACRQAGAHVLISCVTAGNEACERMNLRQGFTLCGVLPDTGRKFDQWLGDALYYKLLP